MQQPGKSENQITASGAFTAAQSRQASNSAALHPSLAAQRGPMKLLPWRVIWSEVRAARMRAHGAMIHAFHETLFNEAMFDDHGAWSQDRTHRS